MKGVLIQASQVLKRIQRTINVETARFVVMLITVGLLLCFTATCFADVPRPRGVALSRATLYTPREDQTWVCLDGSRQIRFLQINDDYCDCRDGSDEPGTSACSQGRFHCSNIGHRPLEIPSSRVNDGICDCCDVSDEYITNAGQCRNTCQELGRAEQEQRKNEVELYKQGASKRAEMIVRGKQLRAEREVRRVELERRRLEQEAVKIEREALKNHAEALEAEALELYKEQQRENEPLTAENTAVEEEEPHAMRVEAEASFVRYDVNKDGFVELIELQVDMTLDRDRNGVVTVEEAKYFLDERDRIDLEAFVLLSWPRIKPLKMLAQGLFKPPKVHGEEEEEAQNVQDQDDHSQANDVYRAESNNKEDGDAEHPEDFGTEEEEEEVYEDEESNDAEADVGVGSVHGLTTPAPEYDPETQRLIDLANEARNAYTEVEREIGDIERETKDIDEQDAKDYGPNDEYASMDGQCYKFEDREYIYTLCPFDRASQKSRNGGSETTLGRWDQWLQDDSRSHKYAKQKYSNGASCWNGPQRSTMVHLRCAVDERITGVSEPNRCEYYFDFETPAACDTAEIGDNDGDRLHDEL